MDQKEKDLIIKEVGKIYAQTRIETTKQIFREIESMLNVSKKTEFVLTSKRFKQIKAKFLQDTAKAVK